MPTYEYKCKTHNDESKEEYRTVDERDSFPLCDHCKEPMYRVWQANPVKFNGTGFYSTGG